MIVFSFCALMFAVGSVLLLLLTDEFVMTLRFEPEAIIRGRTYRVAMFLVRFSVLWSAFYLVLSGLEQYGVDIVPFCVTVIFCVVTWLLASYFLDRYLRLLMGEVKKVYRLYVE